VEEVGVGGMKAEKLVGQLKYIKHKIDFVKEIR
jgi:hypothetical protein